jgi:predicted membrane protein
VLGIILIPLIILLRIILIPWIRSLILVLVLLRIYFLIRIGTTLIRVYRIWIIIMVWRRVLLILGPLIENEVSRLWGRLMMMMMMMMMRRRRRRRRRRVSQVVSVKSFIRRMRWR